MDIFPQLKLLGLNHSEITVYLFLLENGISTPPNVSRGTNIARTNCYNILEELKNKGLVEEQAQGKRKAYIASDPESLVRSLEQKKEAAQRILPDLRGLYTTQKNKPKIKYFDGVEQIKEIYRLTLCSQKIMEIGSTEYLSKIMPEFYLWYLENLKKRNIVLCDVLTPESKTSSAPIMQDVLKGLYDIRFLPDKYRDFPTDLLIWDDNIAFITLEEPIFGTVLTNKLLARTFNVIFEIIRNST